MIFIAHKNSKTQNQIKITLILLILLISSVYSLNFSNNPIESNKKNKDGSNNDLIVTNEPQSSIYGQAAWWNNTFLYRKLVNITNQFSIALTKQGVSFNFNYTGLVAAGMMQDDLEDIRIVENGVLRNYYYKKDLPKTDLVTVWFETDILASRTETDTYLYYGNPTVGKADSYFIDERFGVAWYRFEQNRYDSSGNNNNPSVVSGTGFSSPKIENNSLSFSGNEYVEIPDSTSLSPRYEVSISFWVNLTSAGSQTAIRKNSQDYLFEFGTQGGNNAGTNPQFYVTTSSGQYYIYGTTGTAYESLTPNKWYHCVGTYNYLTGAKMYINGQLATVTTGYSNLGQIADSNSYLHLGYWGGEVFRGKMDDVRIFDRVLTTEDIAWIYSFNRTLSTKLNELQIRKSAVKVIAKDLYGNAIPFVNISMYNKSVLYQSKIAGSDGSANFEDIDFGDYNFTVFMSANAKEDLTVIVNNTSNAIPITGSVSEITLKCRVSSHTFTVLDADGAPVESGYITVGNKTIDFGEIQNCTIDQNGNARFWWVNCTPYEYNFTVKYRNNNYNPPLIKLANGTIDTPNEQITVHTNLTTVNFTVISTTSGNPAIPGAILNLTRFSDGKTIVNLTTDEDGKVSLRWVNSSQIEGGRYNLRLTFWISRPFDINDSGFIDTYDFTVSKKTKYNIEISTNPSDYQTKIISLNPTDDIEVTWDTQLTIRYLFNVTKVADPIEEGDLLGPKYADIMTYKILKAQITVLTGSIPRDLNNEGRHQVVIDTKQLEVTTYIIEITAQRIGYSLPDKLTPILNVKANDLIINQSENDDSPVEVYWLEPAEMTVKPYGYNTESFTAEDAIYYKKAVTNDYNLKLWIPDISTDWNLSQIVFNLYNVNQSVAVNQIYITITDIQNDVKWTWDDSDTDNYYYYAGASNGTWTNLLVNNLNMRSKTNNNTFEFKIAGNFTGSVDVVARASFIRDKMNVIYYKFNVTDSITITSDRNGWAIQNITFLIENCRDPTNNWNIINPAEFIDNITINEGKKYDFINGRDIGTGNLTIDDRIIYPVDDKFSFTIGNTSKIMFDVKILVEYVQLFYWNSFLEIYNVSSSRANLNNNTIFEVSPTGNEWSSQNLILSITELKNALDQYIPISAAKLNLTIGTTTYYFNDFGILILSTIDKDVLYTNFTIHANQEVTFDLTFLNGYSRTVSYEILGTINYQIREEPDIYGIATYDTTHGYYIVTIDTSLIDADDYTVRFTPSITHYSTLVSKDLDLTVNKRLTLLNGNIDLVSTLGYSIYVKDAVNFTFTYIDRDLILNITNLNVQSYTWKQYSTAGVLIDSGAGILSVNAQNQYVVDFNTETKSIGSYTLIVRLAKNNYDDKIATISLTINLRTFEYELGDEFEDKQVSVVKGKKITLSIKLTDPTKGNAPLTGAKVVLEIGNDKLEFDEVEPGVYELDFDTEKYEAFFASNTLTGTIKISKGDYISDEVDITIVVQMQEIFPGIPTFYFIMVVAAIAAVAGALMSYKAIQIARIPKFVKKARAIKKAIKAEREISESLLTDTKEEMISKQFEDDWNSVGLSLKDILGVKEKQVIPEKSGKLLSKIKGGAE